MPSIDERVVAMAFENAKFEAGVAKTMSTLTKLDTAIKNIGNASGLENIEKAANKVTLQQPMSALDKLKSRFGRAGNDAAQGMSDIEKAGGKVQLEQPIRALNKVESATGQVGRGAADGFGEIEKASNHLDLRGATNALESLANRFSLIQGAATVAFGNIQAQAALKGAAFAKSFAFGPIQQGFQEYQTNLGSIQTILANTADSGGNLKTVNAALQELNTYSDKTIYNFSEMAKNIGTFTAAGVQLKPATAAIKGIANLAALSGSNSQQASTAMYQLSQAISAGRVGLQDWNSVVNAGMGGAVFQKSLMRTAENMGTIEKGAIKIDKATGKATINGESFRNSIMAKPGQDSWLTSDVLTKTLSQMTGDMSNAQLAAEGFNAEQIKAIQAQAKMAQDAATQVKTLPQVFDVARETIGSGWSKTFQTIFGDFGESKKSFTDLSNFINGIINKSSKARNEMLADWKKLGGRDVLIQGLKQAFQDLQDILKPIHDAFRDIFPAKTGKDLFETTKGFAELMKRLQPSKAVMDGLQRTFRGFFAVLHIGWAIVKGVVGVIGDLLGTVGKGSGGFLNFTGSIGDFLVAVDQALTKGGLLSSFFKGLSSILKLPLQLLSGLAAAVGRLFEGVDSGAADKVAGGLGKVKEAADPLAQALDKLKGAWDGFKHILSDAKSMVQPWLDKLGNALNGLKNMVVEAFKGGNSDQILSVIQTGFVGAIFLAIKKALGTGVASFTGILKPLNGALSALTGNLTAMQKNVKAQTLTLIATAIGILAASAFVLAKIDPKALTRAMTAIAIGLGELMGAMKLMTGGLGLAGIAQMPILAGSLVVLAGSLVILAAAMKIFATLSWDEMEKGLVGIGGGLAAIGAGLKVMGPGTIVQAPALLVLSVALNAIALAVKQFASLSWDEIARGLAGVLGSLVAMIAPITEAGPMLTVAAPGVIGIAFALNLLAGAVKAFGEMDLKQLITGLIGATLALAGIGVALWAIPPHAALLGAGLIVVAVGMTGIAAAVKAFGSMSIGELAKGLIAMGFALAEMAVGLTAMIVALPGAAALLVAAGAFALLAPTLGFLGTLNWGTIFKGLAAIALTLGTLAIAGTVAAPGLIILGTALLPLGIAFAVVAAAAYLFALAIEKVASDGAKGVGILIGAIAAFIAVLPKLVIDLLKGLVDIVTEVAKIAPQVVAALVKIATQLLDAVIMLSPKIATAIGSLVQQLLTVIIRDSPKLIQAGWTLILNVLKGIDQHISEVVNRVGSIITKFLSAFAAKAPALASAGARALVAFLNGIADHITDVVAAGARILSHLLLGIAKAIPGVVGAVGKIIVKFIGALGDQIPKVVKAGVGLATKLIHAIAYAMLKLADVGAKAIIDFMNALADQIERHVEDFVKAGFRIGAAVVKGFAKGIADVKNQASNALNEAIFNNEGKGSQLRAEDIKHATQAKNRGVKRHALEGAYDEETLNQVFGPKGKIAAAAHKGGATAAHKVAEGFKETGKKEIGPAVDEGTKPLKKPIPLGKPDVTQLQKTGAEVQAAATEVAKKIEKPFEPLGIKLGGHMVNGLKAGLRGLLPVMMAATNPALKALVSQSKSLHDMGVFLGTEFRQGLTGGLWESGKSEARQQIEGSFKALKAKLAEERGKLKAQVKSDSDELKQLMGERNKNWGKIGELQQRLMVERQTLAQSKGASRSLMASMLGEQSILIKLAANYTKITKQLEDAKAKLQGLKDDRKNAIQQYTDQFSALPDIGQLLDSAMSDASMTWAEKWDALRKKQEDDQQRRQIDQVANYKKALQDQITATLKYTETLNKLRAIGLDNVTYKKLLEMGTAGQEFASQLLSKGKPAVDQINALDTQLATAAGDLGTTAGHQLYDVGIKAAQGIVDGLKASQEEIKKTMITIAKSMVFALKFALGIKSPSRVFAELGVFSVQGLAEGLTASSNLVQDAAGGIGDDAAEALTNSLAKISDHVQNGIDTDVTITPVLDLSQVQKDASKIQDLSNVIPISAAASYGQAAAISQTTQETAAAQAESSGQPTIEVNLEQTNTSPKALDDVEIYRNTRNQLSQVKSALGLVSQLNS